MCVNKQQISIVLKRPLKVLCVVAFFSLLLLSFVRVIHLASVVSYFPLLVWLLPPRARTHCLKSTKKSPLWVGTQIVLFNCLNFRAKNTRFIFQEFKFMSSLCFVDFFKVIFKHCESLFSVSTYFALHWFALFRVLNYWNGKMARTCLVSLSFYRQQLLTLV